MQQLRTVAVFIWMTGNIDDEIVETSSMQRPLLRGQQ